jgi:hypothetical protein
VIDHAVGLRLKGDSTRLTLCTDACRERLVTRRTAWVYAVVGFCERRHPRTS